jgi:tRNA A-37 threonylcarbamoyl transferase component Bud32
VDKRYESFCLAGPLFYDSPNSSPANRQEFAVVARPLPEGWRRASLGEWQVRVPPGDPIPAQGWKIHVSGTRGNAEKVLGQVFDYCVPRNISFKFLCGPLALHIRNSKYAPRGSSGKLAAIYPMDDASCERILAGLDGLIGGEPGPYVLSDLRYGSGPLYVRYGGFSERYCPDAAGELVPALADASGQLVPDLRGPVFKVPDWITLPAFLDPHLTARNAVTIADLPYRIEKALHFSNGGGVYRGRDTRTGDQIVLKEARPYAGLAADGADAVTRLRREHDMLSQLSGLGVVPGARAYFEAGDHHFLVEDFVEGASLNSLYAHRHPLIGAVPDPDAIAGYTSWALGICAAVQDAVEAIHGRGIVINDLHMFNIMVRPDDSVALIDFEASARIEEGRRPTLGNPGFLAPRDRTGFAIDRYALGCVKLAMFLPLTTLIPLDPAKAGHLAAVVAEHFPVSPAFLDGAVADITGVRPPAGDVATQPGVPAVRVPAAATPRTPPAGPAPEPRGGAAAETAAELAGLADLADWPRARRALVAAIEASATPERDDRLFPGDIEQFAAPGGGLAIASGAAGVLYALDEAGADVRSEHADWLARRAAEPVAGARLGLWDGMTGVACVLDRLGRREAADRVAEIVLAERWERLGADLHGGLSGIALGMLHLADATGEIRLREAGLRAAYLVANRAQSVGGHAARGSDAAREKAGLMRGPSGPALLFIRMHERTGDPGYLDLAAAALCADLDRCLLNQRGALEVDEGWRLMPYLDGGSAGIGLVLNDYLGRPGPDGTRPAGGPAAADAGRDRLEEAAAGITLAASSVFYAQPGLLRGRAGMLFYLAHRQPPGTAACDHRVAAHLQRLAWHALGYGGGVAFPGEALFRISMDLATGTAGVLLALAAALAPAGGRMPFHGDARRCPRLGPQPQPRSGHQPAGLAARAAA